MSDKMREALELIVGRLADHPEYAELIEEQEEEIGGDTAEFSYLVRVGRDALAEQPAQDWSTGQVDADGEPLVTITRAEYDRLKQPAQGEAVALTGDQIARHTLDAGECPPNSQVILVSSIRRLAARNTAPPVPSVTVPEGWKLVPERLTPHMGHAGDATLDDDGSMQEMWTNMLAAAPEVKP